MKIRIVKKQDSTAVYFSSFPSDDARATIKKEGFKWDPRGKFWYSTKSDAADTIRAAFASDEIEESDLSTPENERARDVAELLDALQAARAAAEKLHAVSKRLSSDALPFACYLDDNNILAPPAEYADAVYHLDNTIQDVQTLAAPGDITKDNLQQYARGIKTTLAIKMTYKLDANEASVIRVVDFGPGAWLIVNRCRNNRAELASIPEYKTIPDDPNFWLDVFRELCKSINLTPRKTTTTNERGESVVTWDTGVTLTWQEFVQKWQYAPINSPRYTSCVSTARDAWRVLCELCTLAVY